MTGWFMEAPMQHVTEGDCFRLALPILNIAVPLMNRNLFGPPSNRQELRQICALKPDQTQFFRPNQELDDA